MVAKLAWRPTPKDLTDAAFLLCLGVLAVYCLHTTYTSFEFLAVAAIGLLLGLLVEYVVGVLRGPAVVTILGLIAAYFLFGGAVALRGDPAATWWPSGGTVRELLDVLVHGWRELLTTLPPVVGSGKLLFVPYLLGLVCGGLGLALARRTHIAMLPTLAPLVTAATAILIGTTASGAVNPLDLAIIAAIFTVMSVAWIALRSQRAVTSNRIARGSRLVTAAVLLVAAGAGAVLVNQTAGAPTTHRAVLRDYVEPPIDISALPSPLSGYRKYTESAKSLYDTQLLQIDGVVSGTAVRIAVMTDYTGTAWVVGADQGTDLFQRIGAEIPVSGEGKAQTITMAIGPAYAATDDLNVWVPSVGSPTSIGFAGPGQKAHEEGLRYNLGTRTAVVPDRLQSGDTVTLQSVQFNDEPPRVVAPYGGGGQLSPQSYAFVTPNVIKWTANTAGSAWNRLLAVAAHLQADGTYSDGAENETQYLPGHGLGRLSAFLKDPQLAGDDEQYAATFALMAGSLGFPARVVLGATPTTDSITGADMHAWVEVRISDGRWISIPQTTFMPDHSKRPKPPTANQVSDSNGAVVPPPNAARPPSSLDQFNADDTNSAARRRVSPDDGLILPQWLSTLLVWTGPPVGAILLFVVVVIGAKSWRRLRRRRRGTPAARVAAGWAEVVSRAKDLGAELPSSATRMEQAEALGTYDLRPLAEAADQGVFAPDPPASGEVEEFWSKVSVARRKMGGRHSWTRRLTASLNPRSLLTRT